MALNPQNLKPVQTKEEARQRGRNGGVKSGEARRKQRDVRELTKTIMFQCLNNPEMIEHFKDTGLIGAKEKSITVIEAMIAANASAIIADPTRSAQNFKLLLELMGAMDEIKTTEVEDLTPLADLLQIEEGEDGESN